MNRVETTAQLVTTLEGLREIERKWQRLADATGARTTAHPFWCIPWWRRLGRGRLLVATVWHGPSLVVLAPLHERRLGGARIVRFLGHGLGAVSEMLVAPGHEASAEEAWDMVLGAKPRYLELLDHRAAGGGLAQLRAVSPLAQVHASNACPFALIGSDADEYLAARPKGLRRTLRRADERLSEAGLRHDVEVVSSRERLAEVLGEVMAVYDAAERDNPRQNLLADPWGQFTQDLLAGAAASGRLLLLLGRIDGRLVSFDVGFVSGARLEVSFGRYHPAFARFSPGHLAMRAALGHAAPCGLTEVDLGLGADPYKRRWCRDAYETVTVAAASSPLVLRLGAGVLAARRQVRATLEQRGARPSDRMDMAMSRR